MHGRLWRREAPGKPGLDLNAVLLDFGFRFVFRFGRKVQEKRQEKTKNKSKTTRKTPFRSSPALSILDDRVELPGRFWHSSGLREASRRHGRGPFLRARPEADPGREPARGGPREGPEDRP